MKQRIVDYIGVTLVFAMLCSAMYGVAGAMTSLPRSGTASTIAAALVVVTIAIAHIDGTYISKTGVEETITGTTVIHTHVGHGEAESVDLYGPGEYKIVEVGGDDL